MKRILGNWWPVLFLLFFVTVFSWPFIAKNLVPFPSTYLVSFFPPWNSSFGMPVKNNAMPDVITQIYPWKMLTIRSWKMGQIPLWNPYSFSGTPHAGNYQSAVFSPVNALFFVLKDINAWSVAILLQPLLAGVFMFYFLRALGSSKIAGLMGGVSFMFSGFIVVWMAYGTLAYAVLYLPLILWGIVEIHKKPTVRSVFGIAFGVALSLLSGHFQMSMYVVATSVIFLLAWGMKAGYLSRTLRAFVCVFLGVSMAAPQLIASFDAYGQSVRMTSFVKGEIIPWQYLITVFSPDFYGNPVTRNDWFGHYAEWSSFVGVTALLFALYAIWRRQRRIIWFFTVLGVSALLLATPTPANDLLFRLRIPVLSTSAAGRIIVLVSFSLCVLAGLGIDAIRRDWTARKAKFFTACSVIAMALVGILWGALKTGLLIPSDKTSIAMRNSVLPTGVLVLAVASGIAGFRWKKARALILVFLISISAFESLRFAGKWMPFDPRGYVYPKLDVISFLTEKAGIHRVFGNFGNELGTSFGIFSIEGYDALYQKRYGEFIRFADDGTRKNPERSVVILAKGGRYAQRALDLLGVRYILHKLSDGRNVWAYPYWNYPFYSSVYKDDHYEVLENANALPRYYLASAYQMIQDNQELLRAVYTDDRVGKDVIILENEPPVAPSYGEGDVVLVSYAPNAIEFRIQSKVDKLLFLSDVYDDGWRAIVDGAYVPLLRANYAFRAVAVPAGDHRVQMIYRPRSVTIGLPIALLSLVLLILFARKLRYDYRNL